MEKIKEIDGLRAIAILLVVAWHYLGTSDGPQSLPWRIFIFGRIGVDLFFVLSGYLITVDPPAQQKHAALFFGVLRPARISHFAGLWRDAGDLCGGQIIRRRPDIL
jgi:peptidoglycan/LPS O-acetylase OafA/YrhL